MYLLPIPPTSAPTVAASRPFCTQGTGVLERGAVRAFLYLPVSAQMREKRQRSLAWVSAFAVSVGDHTVMPSALRTHPMGEGQEAAPEGSTATTGVIARLCRSCEDLRSHARSNHRYRHRHTRTLSAHTHTCTHTHACAQMCACVRACGRACVRAGGRAFSILRVQKI
jgi:hypothetical protein